MKRCSTSIWALSVYFAFFIACNDSPKPSDSLTEEEQMTESSEGGLGGLALYTVRDAMAEDPRGTLQKVAEAGYQYVEAAGYEAGKFYGMSPSDFKSYLEGLGLDPVSTHQGSVTFENAEAMMADVKAAGFQYFVIPVPPMGMFEFNMEERTMNMNGTAEELASILDSLGQKAKDAGLELLYHNHAFEFESDRDGVVIFDYLLENCNPDLVNFELDLYWVTAAGADPLLYFEKYPGRFKEWHVKDMDDQGRFAPVGQGKIDFAKIWAQREQSGLKYYYVEQDMTFDGQEPLEAIKLSQEGLKKFGFE